MNYTELIESLESYTSPSGLSIYLDDWAKEYASDLNALDELSIIKRIIDIALNDWRAWYLKDANGERLYIEDKFRDLDGDEHVVFYLGRGFVVSTDCGEYNWYNCKHIVKDTQDTREKIIEDTMGYLYDIHRYDPNKKKLIKNVLNEFTDRIKALEE